MNKPITRWLSFLLAALMLFTQIPLAYASEPEAGDTDASSPGFLSIATDFPDNFLTLDSQEPEKTITPIVLDDSGAVIPLEACTITCRLREDAEAFAWEVNPDNTVTVRPAAPEQDFRVELEITAQWGASVGSCTVLVEYTAPKETSAPAAEQEEEPTAETAYSEETTLPPAEAPTEEAAIPPEETVIPPEETAEAPAEEPAAEPPVSEGSEQEPAAEQTDPLPDSVPAPDEESDESFDIRDLIPEEELAEMTEEEIAWWQEQLLAGNIELLNVGSTQGSILLFNYTDNGNYTTYLNSQVSVTYRPNGTDSAKTAYDKPLDEDEERYQTYFLNSVDTADLLAMLGTEETQPPVCSCSERCSIGRVNLECELCVLNIGKCVGAEPMPTETVPAPTEPAAQSAPKSSAGAAFVLLLILCGAGAAGYFYLIRPKLEDKSKGSTNLNEYDFGLEEDEEYADFEKSEEDAE